LEDKLIALLHQQKTYWKQKGVVKWVALGDAAPNSSMHKQLLNIEGI